jgi:hypothetical protein
MALGQVKLSDLILKSTSVEEEVEDVVLGLSSRKDFFNGLEIY